MVEASCSMADDSSMIRHDPSMKLQNWTRPFTEVTFPLASGQVAGRERNLSKPSWPPWKSHSCAFNCWGVFPPFHPQPVVHPTEQFLLSSECAFRRARRVAGAVWIAIPMETSRSQNHCSLFSPAILKRYQSHPNFYQTHNETSRLHCPKGAWAWCWLPQCRTQVICRWNFFSILVTVFRGWRKSTMTRWRRLSRATTAPGSWYNSTSSRRKQRILYWILNNMSRSGYPLRFHQMLRLPGKVTLRHSDITNCCACHAKRLLWVTLLTFETSFCAEQQSWPSHVT